MRKTLIAIFLLGILSFIVDLTGTNFISVITIFTGLFFMLLGLCLVLFNWKRVVSSKEQALINRLNELEKQYIKTIPEREAKREEIKKMKEEKIKKDNKKVNLKNKGKK